MDYRARHRRILAFFAEVERTRDVRFIWPASALCSGGSCAVEDAGGLLYFDHNHLSVHGARKTASLYRPIWSER